MEDGAGLTRERANFGQGLNDTDLVVGGHHRDECGVSANDLRQRVHIDHAAAVHGRHRAAPSVAF
jgi:hypothetical protein